MSFISVLEIKTHAISQRLHQTNLVDVPLRKRSQTIFIHSDRTAKLCLCNKVSKHSHGRAQQCATTFPPGHQQHVWYSCVVFWTQFWHKLNCWDLERSGTRLGQIYRYWMRCRLTCLKQQTSEKMCFASENYLFQLLNGEFLNSLHGLGVRIDLEHSHLWSFLAPSNSSVKCMKNRYSISVVYLSSTHSDIFLAN